MIPYNEWKNIQVSDALNKIVELFKSGNVPKAIAEATFPPFKVPSNQWSLRNRIIMMLSGTSDARGINQWNMAGRKVNKGCHPFYILAPCIVNMTEKDKETGEDKERSRLVGFKPCKVFRMEDTNGKELDYQKIELPEIPLLNVATQWGIPVKGVAFQGSVLGTYRHGSYKEICLASPNEQVFFHELSHASQDKLGLLKKDDKTFNEVTAELSALVIAQIAGRDDANTGGTYNYIKSYTKEKDMGKYLLKVLGAVEKIVNNILETAQMEVVVK